MMSLVGGLIATAIAAMLGIFAGAWCGWRLANVRAAKRLAAVPAYEHDRAWLRGRARRAARRMAKQLAKELDKPYLEQVLAGPFKTMIVEEFGVPVEGLARE
jgi:hypothetical protein